MEQLFRIKISGYGTAEEILEELNQIRTILGNEGLYDGMELELPSLVADINETTEEQEL